jgi:hypothetical protein
MLIYVSLGQGQVSKKFENFLARLFLAVSYLTLKVACLTFLRIKDRARPPQDVPYRKFRLMFRLWVILENVVSSKNSSNA